MRKSEDALGTVDGRFECVSFSACDPWGGIVFYGAGFGPDSWLVVGRDDLDRFRVVLRLEC
jgi:hypothetical protein